MNVVELTPRGSDAVVMYMCGKCRRTLSEVREIADKCCTCRQCGAELSNEWLTTCDACARDSYERRRAGSEAREAERIAAATAVPETQHAGWVYWPGGEAHNEGYFGSADELREWCMENDREPPARVWACEPRGLSLEADRVISGALEGGEHHESAGDWIGEGGEAALQTLLDAWVQTYAPDLKTHFPTSTAVELDTDAWIELLASEAPGDSEVGP
jgi:hypothetical protein